MAEVGKMEWRQQGDPNEWVFGEPVRGAIRYPAAEVYFDEYWKSYDGGWRWIVHRGQGSEQGGYAGKFEWAIEACEKALEIID